MNETEIREKLKTLEEWLHVLDGVQTGIRTFDNDAHKFNCEIWISVPMNEIISGVWFDFLKDIGAKTSYVSLNSGRIFNYAWMHLDKEE